MIITKWTECIWTKCMECRFCKHVYKNDDGYPNIYIDDKMGIDHLKRLIQSHMRLAHRGKKVWYQGRLWAR